MTDRFNIGPEVRELKLGSTFKTQNSSTSFHTIKYDFKPASVDLNKCATVDVGSNNQVTVTVPNIGSSGTPHTVFKGNQRKYAKECLMIFDKNTGLMTLEKLNHNIQVKKTRSESTTKNSIPPPKLVENSTMRTQSKTKVSTGSRKNNIIGFMPRGSPMQQSGSPLQTTTTTRSPQRAPAWNANNGQATLPSIPMITDDDDLMPMTGPNNNVNMNMNASSSSNNSSMEFQQPQSQHQLHQKNMQQQQKFQQHQQQLPQLQNQQYNNSSNNYLLQNSNSNSSLNTRGANASQSLANAAYALEQEIGVLSSSDSSSSDDSSDSGSDSDSDDPPEKAAQLQQQQQLQLQQQQQQHQHQQRQQQQSLPLSNPSFGISDTASLLHDDLQLSESNSSESEYDFQ